MFNATQIQDETGIRQVESHGELPSTNTRAMELAVAKDVRLPLLVLAERQTAGRGRGDHSWWSAEGSLTFSVLRRNGPLLSLAAGLAVCEACEQLAPDVTFGLKWPNDVLAADRKLCGILIEAPPQKTGRAVIGIGVNVNNSFAAAPAEIRNRAVSLTDVAARRFDLQAVLIEVLRRLEDIAAAVEPDSAAVLERWRKRCVLTGRAVELTIGGRVHAGTCHGIDEQGALLLERDAGTERFVSGTVRSV